MNDINDNGDTALILAARNGHKHIVKFLVNHGMNEMFECEFEVEARRFMRR